MPWMLPRFNLRLALPGIRAYFMLSGYQRQYGITSQIQDEPCDACNQEDDCKEKTCPYVGQHICMWDMRSQPAHEAKEGLSFVQRKFGLPTIAIMSDKKGSYRAMSMTPVTLPKLIYIEMSTPGIDYLFTLYTLRRQKATLRISKKPGRPHMRFTGFINLEYPSRLPEFKVPQIFNHLETVIYETGYEHAGHTIRLGERKQHGRLE